MNYEEYVLLHLRMILYKFFLTRCNALIKLKIENIFSCDKIIKNIVFWKRLSQFEKFLS